jgi:hypothetical protein
VSIVVVKLALVVSIVVVKLVNAVKV